jgi:hypothetical protein
VIDAKEAVNAEIEEGVVLEVPRTQKKVGRESETVGISWRGERLSQNVLVDSIEGAFSRALRGKGTFRFIQEPRSGTVAAALGRAIIRFRANAFVLDTEAFRKQADATDVLRMLRVPLARILRGETIRTAKLLSKRLSTSGGESVWAAPPLGTPLYGYEWPEPEPDFLDSAEGAELIAKSLLVFGRRSKPLVILFRNGELVGPSAHRIFMELARLAPLFPFCGFVFFSKGEPVPEWHVLARLEEVGSRFETATGVELDKIIAKPSDDAFEAL